MPAPERVLGLEDLADMPFGLEPLVYRGHSTTAPCVAMKLDDFVPTEVLERVAKQTEQLKGRHHFDSLRIDFSDDSEERYNLVSLDGGYQSDYPFHATNATLLEGSKRVYTAHIEALDRPFQKVVLKFAFKKHDIDALEREAGFYRNELRRAQKTVVPFYQGYFGATIDDRQITCLVLRFVNGEPVRGTFQELPAQERMWVFIAVNAVHACGLRHNDVHERNFRIDHKLERAWIMDFELASKHDCKHQPIIVGSIEPLYWNFGCPELYELAVATKIWIPLGQVYFCDHLVQLNTIFSWTDLLRYTNSKWDDQERERVAKLEYQYVQYVIASKAEEFYEVNADWFPDGVENSSSEDESS